MNTKYIFVTGGVASSLGKGIIAASLARLLKGRGYSVTNQKLDPYINIDPGTLNPYEHGECYVTEDGAETDLDLGHYERFTGVPTSHANNVTTGRIYKNVIEKDVVFPSIANGKSYNLNLVLGLTSVKMEAEVDDWKVINVQADLPQNTAD